MTRSSRILKDRPLSKPTRQWRPHVLIGIEPMPCFEIASSVAPSPSVWCMSLAFTPRTGAVVQTETEGKVRHISPCH